MASLDTSYANDFRQLSDTVRQLVEGKSNAIGTFTCTPNAGSTVVAAPTCSPDSVVLVSPQTADAVAGIGALWFQSGTGQFTANHANSGVTDRTYGFFVVG